MGNEPRNWHTPSKHSTTVLYSQACFKTFFTMCFETEGGIWGLPLYSLCSSVRLNCFSLLSTRDYRPELPGSSWKSLNSYEEILRLSVFCSAWRGYRCECYPPCCCHQGHLWSLISWRRSVYHGISFSLWQFSPFKKQDFVVFFHMSQCGLVKEKFKTCNYTSQIRSTKRFQVENPQSESYSECLLKCKLISEYIQSWLSCSFCL